MQRDELPGLRGPRAGRGAVLRIDADLRDQLGGELPNGEGRVDAARPERARERVRPAQERRSRSPGAQPPPHLAREQRLAGARTASDEAALVLPQHVEQVQLLLVERDELLLAEACTVPEHEAWGPSLPPELVKELHPARVSRPLLRWEEPLAHRLERFTQVRQVLLPEHGAVEVALAGWIAEGAARERGGHGEHRSAPQPALFELRDEQPRERVPLLARRTRHELAVL